MTAGWLTGVASGVGVLLTLSCATQHDTAQALTVGGAAAVLVGASMAADGQCQAAGPGDAAGYCTSGFSEGTRTLGKGLAVAGVGLAAAGYALTPKGPDRRQGVSAQPAAPTSPYRLVRAAPPEPVAPSSPAVPEAAPAGAAVACGGANVPPSEAGSGGSVPGCSGEPPAVPAPVEAAPEAPVPSEVPGPSAAPAPPRASPPSGSPPVED